jgi:hypothetical protein
MHNVCLLERCPLQRGLTPKGCHRLVTINCPAGCAEVCGQHKIAIQLCKRESVSEGTADYNAYYQHMDTQDSHKRYSWNAGPL